MQLNGDAYHVPLPREGHLSVLVEGGTKSATCRRVSKLEVCQLFSSGSQAVYPVGLNGCEFPVIASPSESLAKGTNLLGVNPFTLKWTSHNPSWRAESQSSAPQQSLLFHPDCKPHQDSSAKTEGRGQHEHGGGGAPIPGGMRHIWAGIREHHPKEARGHGPGHTSAHETGRFPSASGTHHPRWAP